MGRLGKYLLAGSLFFGLGMPAMAERSNPLDGVWRATESVALRTYETTKEDYNPFRGFREGLVNIPGHAVRGITFREAQDSRDVGRVNEYLNQNELIATASDMIVDGFAGSTIAKATQVSAVGVTRSGLWTALTAGVNNLLSHLTGK